MARSKLFPMSLLALTAAVVLLAARPAAGATKAHLRLYMHDAPVMIVKGPSGSFGNTVVIDDVLTDGTASSSTVLGRAQGQYMSVSQEGLSFMVTMNVVLTSGPYAGSSLMVTGPDDISQAVRELSVVGGTGQFRMARGYVLWKTIRADLLDLEIFVNP